MRKKFTALASLIISMIHAVVVRASSNPLISLLHKTGKSELRKGEIVEVREVEETEVGHIGIAYGLTESLHHNLLRSDQADRLYDHTGRRLIIPSLVYIGQKTEEAGGLAGGWDMGTSQPHCGQRNLIFANQFGMTSWGDENLYVKGNIQYIWEVAVTGHLFM